MKRRDDEMSVFPAHAGVILDGAFLMLNNQSVPRTRGGDPVISIHDLLSFECSPHTRG